MITALLHRILFLLLGLLFCTGLLTANADSPPLPLSLPASANVPPPTLIPPAPTINASSYVLMDANTGAVIAESNMNKPLPPASLTKLMTLYLTFQALRGGQIHLTDTVRINESTWQMGGSRMFLQIGTLVPVELLIEGIVVASGNDACAAIAQYIAGTESTFAQLMNQTAVRLGMKNTHYVDSTGLPSPEHYSTAYDIALLTRALIQDFPEYYHVFAQKWLTYNNIKQPNRNRLLWQDPSVDGLKTGHTDDAGYCLTTSAQRNDMRLISVVMGAPSDSARTSDSEALLNYGFRFYKTYKLFEANKPLAQPRVWLGKHKYAELGLTHPLYVTVPVGEYKNLQAAMNLKQLLRAPLIENRPYGNIQITLNGNVVTQVPLVALQNNPKGGLWKQFIGHIALFFKRLF